MGILIKKSNTFYALIATQTVSLIGSHMTSIGVGIWVFAQTGKTAPLLLTSFFNELPGMLFNTGRRILNNGLNAALRRIHAQRFRLTNSKCSHASTVSPR